MLRFCLCAAATIGMMWCAAPAVAQPEPPPPEMLADAELAAVTFVDSDRGWAVGDRGVIWNTTDGGRTWKMQNSGVACRLEAVQFLDGDNGIVVGGWTQPYTHQTHGVVLRTRDGGRTWQSVPGLLLPALKHVRMFDARQGWALGDGSPLFPAGVFRTEDGGRSWAPVSKGETLGWAAGDFRNFESGAVAGLDGSLGLVTRSEIRPARTPNLGPRFLQRMLLAGPTGGWLVGDGGLVLTTNDGGFTWTAPPGPLPEIASEFDFRALAVQGKRVWIAGAPGTCVVSSVDGGQTWQLLRTDNTAPLRGLWFLDEYRGWAVGALGTILHTRDGGQSWRVQRSGGTRAALLGVFSDPQRVPLELVAWHGGNDAYLAAVEVIGQRLPGEGLATRGELSAPRRTQEAVVASGGSATDATWRFPLPEAALGASGEAILARWNRANDGRAAERLEEHLVRRIRQWRPEVIVTEDVSPRSEDPLAHLTNQMTLAAAAKAADPTAYSDQISLAGLGPWKTKKVFAVLAREQQGLVNLVPAQWAPRLGKPIEDQAALGRGLLFSHLRPAPRNVGLSLFLDHLPQASGKRELMSGVVLVEEGEARRKLSAPPAGDLDALRRLAQKRHNVEELLARIESEPTVGAGWIGQVGDLTQGLGSQHAAEILWQLATRYHQTGQSDHAAQAMQLLFERHPQHPLADRAALWLVQYYASGEMAWRQRKTSRFEVRLATATSALQSAESRPAAAENGAGPGPPVTLASAGTSGTAAPDLTPAERAGRALALANQVKPARPALFADPAFQFPLAAAARQSGQSRVADRFYQSLAAQRGAAAWSQNAAAEQWLHHPSEHGPKKTCSAVRAATKPRLDGRLDDPAWQAAKPVALASPEGQDLPPGVMVLAYDDEFLYLAASCRRADKVAYGGETTARTPDSDLAARDRVTLLVDIDRDYTSFYSLTVDDRGWPADECFGDASWNPAWFIATAGDEQYWTVEAAIPLGELTPEAPQPPAVWAVGLQRVIPGQGLQAFSTPAAIAPRGEGFALLVFE